MSIKTFSVNLLIVILVYCSALFRDIFVESVQITSMSGVQFIESGSPGNVTLDCQFEMDEQKDTRLILKWIHKGDPISVYEWLSDEKIRRYSAKIEPFVDKNYSIDDKLTRFRAIRLISPPISLSGVYECSVGSLDSGDIKTTELIVYVKAETFTMSALEVDTGVNITCLANGVFPEPKLSLFRITQSNDSNNNINVIEVKDKTTTAVRRQQSGKYSIELTAQIYEDSYSSIDVTDHYECRLIIEKTDYMETKNLAIQTAITAKVYAIRGIGIEVPKEVIFKRNATFYCNYNIESDRLYSLKWYKRINERDIEFFSYISSSEQTIHHDFAPGVRLDQQKSSKTGDVLYLYDIDLRSEGYYKCEVSADYTFQTIKMESYMTVIVPPTKPPIIKGCKTFYSVGEVVQCFCYPSYSKPTSRIKWFVNEEEVPDSYIMIANDSNSGISFTLKDSHLISGKLSLRCSAFIDSSLQLQDSSEETLINGTNQLANVPLIIGLKSNYMLGQYLDVNCTLPQMIDEKIKPTLQWFIHNEKPNAKFVKRYSIKNTIRLRFRIMQYHLDNNSSLFIKCMATKLLIPHNPSAPQSLKMSNRNNDCISVIINANHLQLYLICSLLSMYSLIEII